MWSAWRSSWLLGGVLWFARKHDQGFVDFTKAQFKKEFGGRERYLIPQDSWQAKGDNVCVWASALGLKNLDIAELGPGYNDTAVYGPKPLIKSREGGKFYEQSWLEFLRHPSNFVMIETWSEFHEAPRFASPRSMGGNTSNSHASMRTSSSASDLARLER